MSFEISQIVGTVAAVLLILTGVSTTVWADARKNQDINCARILLLGALNPEIYRLNAYSALENETASLTLRYGPRMAIFDKDNPSVGLTAVGEPYKVLLFAGALYGEPHTLMNTTLQLQPKRNASGQGYVDYSSPVSSAVDVWPQDETVDIAIAKGGVDAYYKEAKLGAEEPKFRENDRLKDKRTVRVVATIENQVVGYWQVMLDTGAGENLNLIIPYTAYQNDPSKLVAETGRRFVANHYINAQGQRVEINAELKRQIGLDLRYRILSIAHNIFLVKQLWYASSKKTISREGGSQEQLWKAIVPREYVLSEIPDMRPGSDLFLNILGRIGDLLTAPNHAILGMQGDEFLMTVLAHSLVHWESLLLNGLKALELSHQSHLVIGVESYEWLFLRSVGFLQLRQNEDKNSWVVWSAIPGRQPRLLRDKIPNAAMAEMQSQSPLISLRNLTLILDKEDLLAMLVENRKFLVK